MINQTCRLTVFLSDLAHLFEALKAEWRGGNEIHNMGKGFIGVKYLIKDDSYGMTLIKHYIDKHGIERVSYFTVMADAVQELFNKVQEIVQK